MSTDALPPWIAECPKCLSTITAQRKKKVCLSHWLSWNIPHKTKRESKYLLKGMDRTDEGEYEGRNQRLDQSRTWLWSCLFTQAEIYTIFLYQRVFLRGWGEVRFVGCDCSSPPSRKYQVLSGPYNWERHWVTDENDDKEAAASQVGCARILLCIEPFHLKTCHGRCDSNQGRSCLRSGSLQNCIRHAAFCQTHSIFLGVLLHILGKYTNMYALFISTACRMST